MDMAQGNLIFSSPRDVLASHLSHTRLQGNDTSPCIGVVVEDDDREDNNDNGYRPSRDPDDDDGDEDGAHELSPLLPIFSAQQLGRALRCASDL